MVNKIARQFNKNQPTIDVVILRPEDYRKIEEEYNNEVQKIYQDQSLSSYDKQLKINEFFLIATKKIDELSISNKFVALIDTGATFSVISKSIVDKLALPVLKYVKTNTASENGVNVGVYTINLFLPSNHINILGKSLDKEGKEKIEYITAPTQMVSYPRLFVTESSSLSIQDIDMLIGMDVISSSHLTITGNLLIISV